MENDPTKENQDENSKVPTEAEIMDRLKTNPEIQAYFSQFRKNSIETFIKKYASALHNALKSGPAYH